MTLCDTLKEYGDDPNNIHINGMPVVNQGKILNLRFDGVDAETLLLMLDGKSICVSAGSACRSHEAEPSHVLMAMGLSTEDARSSIRISFSKYTTPEEAIEAAKMTAICIVALRKGISDIAIEA